MDAKRGSPRLPSGRSPHWAAAALVAASLIAGAPARAWFGDAKRDRVRALASLLARESDLEKLNLCEKFPSAGFYEEGIYCSDYAVIGQPLLVGATALKRSGFGLLEFGGSHFLVLRSRIGAASRNLRLRRVARAASTTSPAW